MIYFFLIKGSIGEKFYIILKGSVGVLFPTVNKEFTEKAVLREGDSFGELGVFKVRARTASIICKENSHFAVLDKKQFSDLLSK